MASLGKITRRSFLVSSVALAGGVAFGIYAARREPANPLLKDLPNGSAAPNAFVRIDGDGVTLITPRADKGQGVMSVQAHLIAEELDIDPKTVRTDPGQPDQAYFNGQLLADVLPFPQYDNGTVAEAARGITKAPSKWLSLQVTGGSTSVPDLFERLRLAGAVARETLKEAAARETGLDRADLRTEDGAVILPDGARIAYTALAARAAEIAPVRKVQLRPESAWRYLGKEMERLDIPAKSYGRQNYGIDMRLPGMLYATVRSNPGWGGAMLSYDAAEAEGMRGVKAVVPITNGIGVIADNTWRAFQAADAVAVEWGPAPYPASSAEMWGVLETAIGDPESQDSRPVDAGDMEGALAEGTDVEAEYRVPYLAHAPLEPMNATVLVSDTQIEIWTGTQIPVWARNNIAKLTGYAPESIVIHAQMMGGSFGRRLEDSYLGQAVEVAMQMKGVPIKMTWSREEDFTHDFPRPMQLARGRGRVHQGKITAFDLDSCAASMSASWFGRVFRPSAGPDPLIVAGAAGQPFAIPNYRITGYRAPEMVPISSWRAPGANANAFFHESLFDELAHAAGADPLQERLRLCSYDVSRNVLETLGAACNWQGTDLGAGRGRGLAYCFSHGAGTAMVLDVTDTPDGIKLDDLWIVTDLGKVLDPINLEAQLSGAAIFGLGHAMNCELTYADYGTEQFNYDSHDGMRIHQCPRIHVTVLENDPRIRGAGETGTPPAAPALANAIFAATGQRLREMPFHNFVDFL